MPSGCASRQYAALQPGCRRGFVHSGARPIRGKEHCRASQPWHPNRQHAEFATVARARGNTFAELMETVKGNSLGQVSAALYAVGGEYRRNM